MDCACFPASWRPSTRDGSLLLVALFLVARAAVKIGGARLAARLAHGLPELGPHWGRALLGQGGLALALALDYAARQDAPLRSTVFAAAIVSILLTDFASAHLVQSVVAPALERPREADGAAVEPVPEAAAVPASAATSADITG